MKYFPNWSQDTLGMDIYIFKYPNINFHKLAIKGIMSMYKILRALTQVVKLFHSLYI